jgi:HAMP domain-containing protein
MATDPNYTTVALGGVAGKVTDGDIALTIPQGGTLVDGWRGPFETYAESVMDEIGRLYSRIRGMKTYTSGSLDEADGWNCNTQVIRIIGEVWAYGQFKFTRTGDEVVVPADGDLTPNVDLATITRDSILPQSEAGLWTTDTGRLASAYVLNSGNLRVDAIQSGANIETGDILTFAGMWPLDNWYDSNPSH